MHACFGQACMVSREKSTPDCGGLSQGKTRGSGVKILQMCIGAFWAYAHSLSLYDLRAVQSQNTELIRVYVAAIGPLYASDFIHMEAHEI